MASKKSVPDPKTLSNSDLMVKLIVYYGLDSTYFNEVIYRLATERLDFGSLDRPNLRLVSAD
jgi:hypothetical protein